MPTPSFILPSAPVYEEGTLYGLELYGSNFMPSPMSFTRATTATRVNADGLVELVPYNLVTYSEQFDNAAWAKAAASITANTTTAPNGTLTADTLTGNGTNASHYIQGSFNVSSSFTQHTISIYAKKNTNDFLQLNLAGGVFGSPSFANFDLNNGVVGLASGVTASIQSVGNGWYRCSMSKLSGNIGSAPIWIFVVNSATSPDFEVNTLSTSVFLWGAQAVEGTEALPYLKTETRLNRPRVDFSLPGCPNLLLEPQRTNLARQSSYFDNASWTKSDVIVTANTTTSPSGIQDADTIALGSGGFSNIRQVIAVLNNTSYTISCYYKNIALTAGQTFEMRYTNELPSPNNFNAIATIDLFAGTVSSAIFGSPGTGFSGSVSSSISNVGNGWYRVAMTFTVGTSGASAIGIFRPAVINAAQARTFYAWGAQIELGAYPTTYIPTTTASVTRNSDSFTESNIFSRGMITAAGGTWFIELRNNLAYTRDGAMTGLSLDSFSGSFTNGFNIRNAGGNSRLYISSWQGGAGVGLYTTTTDTTKIAIKWNGTTADVFANGIKVVSASPFTQTALQFLNATANVGIPYNINQMALFPTPLSDDELEALTGEGFNTYAEMASYYNYTLQ
jgi:hypothetical protein